MSGQIELDSLTHLTPEQKELILKLDAERRAMMSPPGALKLPELLEKRRLEYGIPDGAFASRCVFDRVFIWQIAQEWEAGETFGRTSIVMPEAVKAKRKDQAPRGILVGAGAAALDHLHSNGIEPGHIVSFVRLSPWRFICGVTASGKEQAVLIMRDGDLISSEDLEHDLRAGRTVIRYEPESRQHVVTQPGETGFRIPTTPHISEDF